MRDLIFAIGVMIGLFIPGVASSQEQYFVTSEGKKLPEAKETFNYDKTGFLIIRNTSP